MPSSPGLNTEGKDTVIGLIARRAQTKQAVFARSAHRFNCRFPLAPGAHSIKAEVPYEFAESALIALRIEPKSFQQYRFSIASQRIDNIFLPMELRSVLPLSSTAALAPKARCASHLQCQRSPTLEITELN